MTANGVDGDGRRRSAEGRGARATGRWRVRVAGGRLVALAAVLVMASVGQCTMPQPRFPTLGAGQAHGPTAGLALTPVSAAHARSDPAIATAVAGPSLR